MGLTMPRRDRADRIRPAERRWGSGGAVVAACNAELALMAESRAAVGGGSSFELAAGLAPLFAGWGRLDAADEFA